MESSSRIAHLATLSNVDFSSWDNFVQNKALINTEICPKHTMPQAEYPFKLVLNERYRDDFIAWIHGDSLGLSELPLMLLFCCVLSGAAVFYQSMSLHLGSDNLPLVP
jgi:hypothetical protein